MPKPTQVEGVTAKSRLNEVAPKILLARLKDVRRYEPEGKAIDDLDIVHDMRVASRRLRAAVKLLGNRKLRRLDKRVKALQDALGQKRQLQLDIAWLERRPDDVQSDGARLLLSQEQKRLRKANRALADELERWKSTTVPRLTQRIEKLETGGRLGGRKMRRKLQKELQKFSSHLQHSRPPLQPDVAHALRIQTKKLRYQLEVLSPALEGLEDAIDKVLPDLQTELGDLHDSDLRIELLQAFAKDAKVPIRGGLRHLMKDQRKERVDRARRLGEELQKGGLREKFVNLVRPQARAPILRAI